MDDDSLASLLAALEPTTVAPAQLFQKEAPLEEVSFDAEQLADTVAEHEREQEHEQEQVVATQQEEATPTRRRGRRQLSVHWSFATEGPESVARWPHQQLHLVLEDVWQLPNRPLKYASDCSGGDAPYQAWKFVRDELGQAGHSINLEH